jgi:hypothetical protein
VVWDRSVYPADELADLTSKREKSAIVFLKAFREGKLGKHMLDDIPT